TINKDSGIITPIAAGETVITVTTADAAKKTNKATIKVTVLAESISIDRTELSLEVGDILTMTATIKPALTSDKKVKWASSNANILTINDNGILTANAVGEAYIHAATMDGTNLSTSTKIKVLNGVKSFTISESTHTFNGIGGTHNLIAAAESTGGQKLNVEWKSLNETVATVSANGVVTANGIGNTIITASVLIDNKIHSTLTCVVNVLFAEDLVQDQMDETGFTLPQNDRFSPVTANIMLESYPVNNQSKASLSIMNQYGIMLKEDDVKKFDFQYNNNQIIISDKGEVTPNPSFAPASNTKVTVTATLKNDPLLKRKVTFTVTVVPKAQTKEVKIRHLDSNGNIIKEFANGDYLADYFKTGTPLDTYTLQAIGDKDGLNTKVNWTVTDSSVISLKAGANNTVTVTIRKAGSSGLTVTAQDDFKASQSIIIDAVNSAPLQVERTLTFNRHRTSDNTDLIISDPFNLVEMNGCEIIPNDFIVTSLFRGKLTYEDVAAEMKLHRNSNGTYQLSLPSAALDQLNLAAHTLIVNVPTTSSPRIGGGEGKRDNQLTYTLSIVNRKPTASFTAVAFNLQDLLIEETLLTHRASEKIVSLEPVAGQKNDFDKFFGFKKDLNGNWLIVLKDAARNLTPRTLTGQVNVTMEGFQSITVNMSVRLVNTKDTIIQPIIPQLQYKNDTVALTNLTDRRTGEVLKDYQIVSATPANTLLCTRSNDGTLNLALPNKNYNNGQTIAVTVGVIKTDASGNPIWREPVNVRVSMRVFTAAPIVTTGMSSFNLNTKRKTESAITSMSVNRNNMQITSSNVWRIYYYDTAKKQYILAANPDDLPVRFNYNRAADRLTVSLNPNIEDKAATYQYRIEGMLADFPKVRRDFTVRVGNTDNLRATIAMSGRLDLLKRSESNLGGRIVMTNYTGDIASITLYEIGTTQAQGKINKDFYTVLQANNRFDLKLRNGAIAYTKKTVIPVRLTLSGGSHVDTTLTFTPVQSTPGVTNPAASTFYLNSQNNKAVYGMDTYVNDTAVLKKVVATAPNGITATVDKDNNVTITSASQGIKAGNYNVKVDMYFVGAQPQAGFPDGRPVTRTIRVTVR
ncbi:MAG: Ig-like domain-containing protein, partial [Lachnospiraceae bacterium]|nr:Ig-like domain-containing protein [Lachnospiraceae bacterium]